MKNALEKKTHRDTKRIRRERLIGLVSCALFTFGGPIMRELFNLVFDVWESAAVLSELTGPISEELEISLAKAANKVVCKNCVEAVLKRAFIEPAEFAHPLQKCYRARESDENKLVLRARNASGAEPAPFPNAKPKMSFSDAVFLVTKRLGDEKKQQTVHANSFTEILVDHSHLTLEDLQTKPYHFAVYHSEGSLDEFKELQKHISKNDGTISSALEIRVPDIPTDLNLGTANRHDNAPDEWKTVQASPATYASYMGYVDIVEWFSAEEKSSDHKSLGLTDGEDHVVLIQRARS